MDVLTVLHFCSYFFRVFRVFRDKKGCDLAVSYSHVCVCSKLRCVCLHRSHHWALHPTYKISMPDNSETMGRPTYKISMPNNSKTMGKDKAQQLKSGGDEFTDQGSLQLHMINLYWIYVHSSCYLVDAVLYL